MKFLAITLIVHAQRAFQQKLGLQPVFTDLDDLHLHADAREIPDPPWPAHAPDPLLTGSTA